MQKPEIPINEKERLREFDAYKVFESADLTDFDFLTSMAAEICGTKISIITLLTADKQYFFSSYGLELKETPRDFSFCAHAINKPDVPFIIKDARSDDRFFDNPLTTGYPNVIFYAGIPLVNSKGFPLGTLCVIDDKPGQLTDEQLFKLKHLSRQTIQLLELRRSQLNLKQANESLEQFAYIAAHDLKEPLRGISISLSVVLKKYSEKLDQDAYSYILSAHKSAKRMKNLITDILDFSKTGVIGRDQIDLNELIDVIFLNFNKEYIDASIKLSKSYLPVINGDANSLIQLFSNLIENAIKYQPKDNIPEVQISAVEDKEYWTISVADNGIGIDLKYQEKVFEVFKRLHSDTEYEGTGIGLANCKKIVNALGGEIWYEANNPKGTIFKFTILKN